MRFSAYSIFHFLGVRVHRSSGDVDIHAPIVISNAGVMNTMTYLLPPEVAQRAPLYKFIQNGTTKVSPACLQVFVGLKGTAKELKMKAQNVWSYNSVNFSQDLDNYMKLSAAEAAEVAPPLSFISFNAAKDPTFEDRFPGRSTVVVIGLCNESWFESWDKERVNKRGADYDHLKEQLGQSLWRVVLALFPHLEDKVEYFEVGTSLSNNYYLGTRHGEMYGLDHGMERFGNPEVVMNLRPSTGIKGLYLSGQDLFTAGYCGALMGGVLTAATILGRDLFDDAEKLGEKLKKLK